MIGELPRALDVNGRSWAIRTDYRDILKILSAFSDPELENEERVYICLFILFVDFERIPQDDYAAAYDAAIRFIDTGRDPESSPRKRIMDWEQDEQIMFPAVNKVAGYEVRAAEYIHWWTFIGFYMEISEGVFSHVLALRAKKAAGEKLEKHERKYWDANKSVCVLRPKLTEEERAAKDRLNALLG